MSKPFKIFLCGFGLLVLFVIFSTPGLRTLAWLLLTGWIQFLVRTVPLATANWDAINLALICSVLVLAGIHSFGRWVYGHAKGKGTHWSWRMTLLLFTAVWMGFAFIIAATGLLHQLTWLADSNEPLYIRDPDQDYRGMMLSQHFPDLSGTDSEAPLASDLRKGFLETQESAGVLESERLLIFPDPEGRMKCILAVSRNPRARTFVMIFPDGRTETRSLKQFPALLAELDGEK